MVNNSTNLNNINNYLSPQMSASISLRGEIWADKTNLLKCLYQAKKMRGNVYVY
jgi:hypothetical protein